MYNTFNYKMSIAQFIGFKKFVETNRKLSKKESEALASIAKRTTAYTKSVKASGNKTSKITVLISFKSNKIRVKNIELAGIEYAR